MEKLTVSSFHVSAKRKEPALLFVFELKLMLKPFAFQFYSLFFFDFSLFLRIFLIPLWLRVVSLNFLASGVRISSLVGFFGVFGFFLLFGNLDCFFLFDFLLFEFFLFFLFEFN